MGIMTPSGTPYTPPGTRRKRHKKLTEEQKLAQREAKLENKARQVGKVYQAAKKDKKEAQEAVERLEDLRRRMEALARLPRDK